MKKLITLMTFLAIIFGVLDVDNMLIFFASKVIAIILIVPAFLMAQE